jgi:threonine dehydratase
VIHPRAVTEFIYRYSPTALAHIFVSFKIESSDRAKEVVDVLTTLEAKGMKGFDISDDEMSKSHARYMIGGCQDVAHERVFRFGGYSSFSLHRVLMFSGIRNTEFPERPGALRKFLLGLHSGWNISLFHYRNHGGGTSISRSTTMSSFAHCCCRPWEGLGWHPSSPF